MHCLQVLMQLSSMFAGGLNLAGLMLVTAHMLTTHIPSRTCCRATLAVVGTCSVETFQQDMSVACIAPGLQVYVIIRGGITSTACQIC